MEIHRVSTYHDVEHALRITDLNQSLYDEGKILMDKVLVTLHGDEHRQRRSIESQLFRKNFFRVYESQVFPGLLQETLDQFLTTSSLDLKELGYRIMVHLSLSFAGIDRVERGMSGQMPKRRFQLLKWLVYVGAKAHHDAAHALRCRRRGRCRRRPRSS